jgi:hypothetical protein
MVLGYQFDALSIGHSILLPPVTELAIGGMSRKTARLTNGYICDVIQGKGADLNLKRRYTSGMFDRGSCLSDGSLS